MFISLLMLQRHWDAAYRYEITGVKGKQLQIRVYETLDWHSGKSKRLFSGSLSAALKRDWDAA